MKLTKSALLSAILGASSSTWAASAASSKLIRARNLQDDTTPPTIESFSPDAGVYITEGASAYRFRVIVSDESSIRAVKFQLRDPNGDVGSFQNGQLETPASDGSGAEGWASPAMDLGSGGAWSWRARVIDDSPARNDAVLPWKPVTVLAGEDPAAVAVGMVRSEIEALADANDALRPKFLRMGFHDCVGGCDGCIDMLNPDNAGLDVPIDALSDVVARYAHDEGLTAAIGSPISRADIWALATLVGVDQATGNQRPEGVSYAMTHIGRSDCEGADADGYGGPHRDLPGPDLTTHELLAFFDENFGFAHEETVCIMGAHTIGIASRRNSGFDGANGWVNNPGAFSNGYYDMLIGGSVDPDNFYDLIHAPQWTQELVRNTNRGTKSRMQWIHQKQPCGGAANCTDTGDDDRQLEKIIMTNSDIALVRDLTEHFEDVVLTNADGTEEVVPGSVTTCSFRCGGQERLTGCPNRNPPLCPHAAETFFKASEYKFDNDLFIQDFEAVLDKMVKNGYAESDLVAVQGAAAQV